MINRTLAYSTCLNKLLTRKSAKQRSLLRSELSTKNPYLLSKALNYPFKSYECIHVAGTNGKGSVCTKLAYAFHKCGYNVGLFTSPHIHSIRERIRVNGEMISEEDFINGTNEIEKVEALHNLDVSFFEFMTLLGFYHFEKSEVDIAVIETGLGGRFDATNIIEQPLLSVITSISYDHMATLGNTLEEITFEKAGIIKDNCPVVIGNTVPRDIIYKRALETKSSVYSSDYGILYKNYNDENTQLTKLCINILKKDIKKTDKINLNKLSNINNKWLYILPECRFEEYTTTHDIQCILDVAHNSDGINKLFKQINSKYNKNKYCYRIVVGLTKGKLDNEILDIIANNCKNIHLVQANNSRAVEYYNMKDYLINNTSFNSKFIHTKGNGNVKEEMRYVIKDMLSYKKDNKYNKNKKEEILIICGSFYFMSDAKLALGCPNIKNFTDPFLDVNMTDVETKNLDENTNDSNDNNNDDNNDPIIVLPNPNNIPNTGMSKVTN